MVSVFRQLLHSIAPQTAPSSHQVVPGPFEIKIHGDDRFAAIVKDALDLIAATCPGAYEVVTAHVAVIEGVDRQAERRHQEPPRIALATSIDYGRDLSARSKTIWYAGAIVHEAWHSRLHREFRLANPGAPWPADDRSAAEREDACLRAQHEALVAMGASMWMLDYVKGRMGPQSGDADARSR